MNDGGSSVLLSADEIEGRVAALARRLAEDIDDDWVVAPILLGGLWFTADLTRALARLGRHPRFDALWLASYGGARQSAGRCQVVAPFQRPVAGLDVLILDEVFETGLSLAKAIDMAGAAGARRVRSAVFARKPAPRPRTLEPDYVAWEAPARFLTGYGMDLAGRQRGLPWIAAEAPAPA
jgi:hypoxanthine phosphoribosyltransferase